ncbi:MurR/RpiR family transcriptional regulator [Streptomyces sp. H10-C2]|uniref:MurR/RpiR family transcriptional regulator n=1 Tax=unclassified Streptomyces TaxID=2593676 RepID=UPI0024B87FAB|nr:MULTISPECIES: MurR/RpiR family transcriptional regulator [unclassified Streptomyces]MDJ0343264.1 MurR/RpiR family transcriptional regulator [Streptomyces sp. PH10-H1]MDJ0370603.1 MurR/RpiR family transcriptional regulator [Streptomyces sp. H10-C2]
MNADGTYDSETSDGPGSQGRSNSPDGAGGPAGAQEPLAGPGDGLAATVRGLLPSLTPASARIARLIVEDPDKVARSTISELSALAGTSDSSIVRTARALGFSGYPELRLALAASAARQTPRSTLTSGITPQDSPAAVIAKLVHTESQAVLETETQLDPAQLLGAVRAVCGDGQLHIAGVGASGLVAQDLHQKLQRIGRPCHAHGDSQSALTSAVLLGSGDVFLAVSHSGESRDVLEPLRRAAAQGATTVVITNHPLSSAARLADFVLASAGRETTFRPGAMASRISQLVVVDCLFVCVAQRTYEKSDHALRVTYEALESDRT